MKWFRKAAEQGLAIAQFNLGVMYDEGRGAPQDYAEAVKWYRKAAEQGDARAQLNLGGAYYLGHGVPKDYAEALRWLRKAAAQGNKPAGQLVAKIERNHPEMREAEKRHGLPTHAQDYRKGQEAFRRGDWATALREWRPLAEQGNGAAQRALGNMYNFGWGVPKDYAAAVKWYRKAAEQELAIAQFNLGAMYVQGRGVPQDYAEAHMWFDLAASRYPPGENRDRAVKNRDIAAERMTPAQISEAQKLAREWKPKK